MKLFQQPHPTKSAPQNNPNGYPFENLTAHTQELALMQIKQRDTHIHLHANHHPWFYGLNLRTLHNDLVLLGFSHQEIASRTRYDHCTYISANGNKNPFLEFETDLDLVSRIHFPNDIDVIQQELENGKRIFAKRPHTLPKPTRQYQWKQVAKNDLYDTSCKSTTHTPRCPTCASANVRSIYLHEKAGSVLIWGVFSRRAQKQFHCSNCGYEW